MFKSGVVCLHHVAMVIHLGGSLLGAIKGAVECVVLGHQVLHLLPEVVTLRLAGGVLVVRVRELAGQEAVDELLNAVADTEQQIALIHMLQHVDESYLLLCVCHSVQELIHYHGFQKSFRIHSTQITTN